jgi:hypothetical protein
MDKFIEILHTLYRTNTPVFVTVTSNSKTSTKRLYVVDVLSGNNPPDKDWVLFRDTFTDTDISVYRKFHINDIDLASFNTTTKSYYINFKNGVLPYERN